MAGFVVRGLSDFLMCTMTKYRIGGHDNPATGGCQFTAMFASHTGPIPLLRFTSPHHNAIRPMHDHYIFYLVALFGVIGIGWLLVVPMYKGWTPLNQWMTRRIRKSIRAMAEDSRPGRC